MEQWTTGAVRDDQHTYTSIPLWHSYLYINSIASCAGHRWVIERRVAGTKQISTVGQLPPDPPPLSFLDSSSALSPWTSYQYRLVPHNQAGNTTGKAITMGLIEIKFSLTRMCVCATYTFSTCLVPALWNSPLYVKLKDECFVLHIFHILLHTCRTLGQYHHQTLSASWSQSTEGEGLGARVTSGMDIFFS